MEQKQSARTLTPGNKFSQYATWYLNETEQSGNNSPPHICRVCLNEGKIPLFGENTFLDISADVMAFGDIELSIEDNFSKYICKTCVELLEAAILFRKTAKQSDKYLRSNRLYDDHDVDDVNALLETPRLQIAVEYEDNSGTSALENDIVIKEEIVVEPFFFNDNNTLIGESFLEDSKNNIADSKNDEYDSTNLLLNERCYKCNTCNLDFNSSKEYSNHKQSMEHKKMLHSRKTQCKICSKNVSMAYYNRHMEQHSIASPGEKLQCPICNKSYSKTYFNYHLTHTHKEDHNKTESERVQCSVCKKLYEKHYYKFHLAIHNNDLSKYICDTCGKSFIQQSAFKRHSLIHGSELAYKCTLCSYRGRHPGLVKTHMQTHTKEYHHRCMECPARFLTKSNLNKHLKRHRGPVDFKCETCKRGFYSKLELDRHFEANHLGVKNHVCNVCGKAFGYRNAMMSHQLKVHKREKLTDGKGRMPLYLEEKIRNENKTD